MLVKNNSTEINIQNQNFLSENFIKEQNNMLKDIEEASFHDFMQINRLLVRLASPFIPK